MWNEYRYGLVPKPFQTKSNGHFRLWCRWSSEKVTPISGFPTFVHGRCRLEIGVFVYKHPPTGGDNNGLAPWAELSTHNYTTAVSNTEPSYRSIAYNGFATLRLDRETRHPAFCQDWLIYHEQWLVISTFGRIRIPPFLMQTFGFPNLWSGSQGEATHSELVLAWASHIWKHLISFPVPSPIPLANEFL